MWDPFADGQGAAPAQPHPAANPNLTLLDMDPFPAGGPLRSSRSAASRVTAALARRPAAAQCLLAQSPLRRRPGREAPRPC
jgi:hypothetical protein